MARKTMQVQVQVNFIGVSSEEDIRSLRAGLSLLLRWIKDAKNAEACDGVMDVDRNSHADRIRAALLPLADVVQGQGTAAPGSVHAGLVGDDGSAHRLALGAR